jgi:hypothetical protein
MGNGNELGPFNLEGIADGFVGIFEKHLNKFLESDSPEEIVKFGTTLAQQMAWAVKTGDKESRDTVIRSAKMTAELARITAVNASWDAFDEAMAFALDVGVALVSGSLRRIIPTG